MTLCACGRYTQHECILRPVECDVNVKQNSIQTAKDICQKASEYVSGDREATHGDKLENHTDIAKLWSAYLGKDITPTQAAVMMMLLKVARTKVGKFNIDDYIDMAGYAGVAGEVAQRS